MFKHGLRTAWYRDVVRPKILREPPLEGLRDGRAEIHALTSGTDWLNLLWSLRSFYAVSPYRLALCIHVDPTTPEEAVVALQQQFPDARVITASVADEEVLSSLESFPRCSRFRETNKLARKIFDFRHYLNADKLVVFDSDLLFFARPHAFFDHLDDGRRGNVFNRDVASCYAVDPEKLATLGVSVLPELNSGFGIAHRESLCLDWIEEFLSIKGMLNGHFWRIEQTIYALLCTRWGGELLPEQYRVYLDMPLGDRPFRHYVGAIRHLMYRQGVCLLHRKLLART